MTTWREKLKERSQRAVGNKDSRGLGRKSILDLSLIKLPEWSPKSGKEKNYIDIMPWKVTQTWYKNLRTRSGDITKLDIGDVDYKLEVAVHRYTGPTKDMFLCLREAFGKTDAVCEDMFTEYQKRKEGNKDFNADKARTLQPTWRCFYIVYDYDDDKKGFQLWEASYELFEKYLLDEMKTCVDEGGLVIPWDLIDGRSIEFKGREKKLGNNSFIEAEGITFQKRDPYNESILDKLPSLDQALIIPSYEQIRMSHYGLEEEEGTETDKAQTAPPSEHTETGRTRRTRQEETPPPPALTTGRTRREPEISPPPSAGDIGRDLECPAGGKFGEDCNRLKACQDEACDQGVYEACMKKADELSKKTELHFPPATSRSRGASDKSAPTEQPSGRTRRR